MRKRSSLSRITLIIINITTINYITANSWDTDLPHSYDSMSHKYVSTTGEGIKQKIDALGNTANSIEDNTFTIENKVDELLDQSCPCCATMLYASDFSPTGTTITTSGYYILCEDVPFDVNGGTALIIDTSHVTINLNGHALYNPAGSNASQGIVLNNGTTDITIKNGSISNFKSHGIQAIQNNHNITFNNLLIEKCAGDGIHFVASTIIDTSSNITLSNCIINQTANNGFNLYLCSDVYIKSCSFIQSLNNDHYGVRIFNCNKCYFESCHFDDNADAGVFIIDQPGTEGTKEICFLNCTFNNNKNAGLSATSFNTPSEISGIVIDNCQSLGDTAITSTAYGFYLNNIEGAHLSNCKASAHGNDYAYGIYLLDSVGCRIENCTSFDNTGTDKAVGISIDGTSTDNIILGCKTNHNIDTDLTSVGTGAGIEITANTINTVIQECSAFSNTTYGIYNDSSSTIIARCTTGNNSTNYGGANPAISVQIPLQGGNINVTPFANVRFE